MIWMTSQFTIVGICSATRRDTVFFVVSRSRSPQFSCSSHAFSTALAISFFFRFKSPMLSQEQEQEISYQLMAKNGAMEWVSPRTSCMLFLISSGWEITIGQW